MEEKKEQTLGKESDTEKYETGEDTLENPTRGYENPEIENKIGFLIYFKPVSFISALSGSIIGILAWLTIKPLSGFAESFSMTGLYATIITAALLFFVFLAKICRKAGCTTREACRIAGRRGLFTFTVMLATVICSLVISGRISWEQDFYYFVRYLLQGMIMSGIPAVPFDYGISYLKTKKKNSVRLE